MTPDVAIELGRKAIFTVLIISAPLLGLGLLVGVLISIFQAVTQIQEMTLTFVPKIVITLLAIVFFGPWLLTILLDYTLNLFSSLPNYVR